jgi:hypothetical protein
MPPVFTLIVLIKGFVRVKRTEELLAGTAFLDDFDQTGLQLLDGRDVVGEDTHLTGLGRNVDLDDILGSVDGLHAVIRLVLFFSCLHPVLPHLRPPESNWQLERRRERGEIDFAYLVGKGQAELDLLFSRG